MLLGVLFIGLKLGGIISWSWFWVTLPLWWYIPFITLLFTIIGVIVYIHKIKVNKDGK